MSLKKGENIVFTKLAVSQKTFWAKSLVGQEAAGKAYQKIESSTKNGFLSESHLSIVANNNLLFI